MAAATAIRSPSRPADKTSGPTPLTVAFSSAGSSDPEGKALTYSWDFGDGSTSTAANPSHTYTTTGTFRPTLTVRDPEGLTGTASLVVTAGNTAPTVNLTGPKDGELFSFGDTVPFSVTLSDPEDGAIDCAKVKVTYLLGHDEHRHAITSKNGCTGTIAVPTDGEHDSAANLYGVFDAEYTDGAGLTTHSVRVLQPRHRQAEHFSAQSGIQVAAHGPAEGGNTVGFTDNGDWISFKPYAVGNTNKITARVASGGVGGTIEVRTGSATGTLLGTMTVPVTGGWETFTDVSANLANAPAGTTELFLVFKGPTGQGNLFDVDAFTFTTGSGATGQTMEGESYTSPQGVQIADHAPASGGKTLGFIENGDWAGYASVPTAGTKTFSAKVSSAGAGGTIQIPIRIGDRRPARLRRGPAHRRLGDLHHRLHRPDGHRRLRSAVPLLHWRRGLPVRHRHPHPHQVKGRKETVMFHQTPHRPSAGRRRIPSALASALVAALALIGAFLTPAVNAQAADPAYKVLVFSKTAGFRHDPIPAGTQAIRDIGAANNFTVTATEDGAAFTPANLAGFKAVVFLPTTGDVLNATQQSALQAYVDGGGGYFGIHAAADTEYDWPQYEQLVGAWFKSHPAIQPATLTTEDRAHAATAHLGQTWSRTDEWYNYRTNPRANVRVLQSLDESSYSGGEMSGDHPITWCHAQGSGRSFYTGLGHTPESYADPAFRSLLLGGIRYAAGFAKADCRAESGYTPLYNGSTTGWSQAGPGSFTNTDATLTSQGGMGLFWYRAKEYNGYSLKLDWKMQGDDNSGVFVGFPASDDPNSAVNQGYEIQIDATDAADRTTGAVYGFKSADIAARDAELNPPGEWNGYEIRVEGERLQVFLNGVRINDFTNTDPARSLAQGYIGIQNHGTGDDVSFRNIRIKELGGTGTTPSTFEGESYTSSSGVQPADHASASGGRTLGYIENGDWAGYSQASLTGTKTFTAKISSGGSGGTVQVRSGSATGPVLGSLAGGWENFRTVSTALTGTPTGPVFLTFTGGAGSLFDIDTFTLEKQAVTAALSSNVHLFYYPWYGSPVKNGSYRHWQQGGRTPPQDIGADLYPKLGAYDSGDFAGAVAQHMRWVKQSGAGVIVYSWWGRGGYEDTLAKGVLDAAQQEGVKAVWHIELYAGRTAASVVSDIQYLNSTYGSHPAYYRDAEHNNRPAFYIFESLRITDWAALDQVTQNNTVLAQTTDTSKIAHFSGLYTYDGIAGATAPGWKQAGDYAKANGLIWAPSVAPGYIDDRAVPGNTTPTLGRDNGAIYDKEWNNALDPAIGGSPTWVSVTSFNEWHEGSSIEPAAANPPAGFGYQTFSGAYGKTGTEAETVYLDRTRYWVGQFDARRVR